jgi:hypothetical protein
MNGSSDFNGTDFYQQVNAMTWPKVVGLGTSAFVVLGSIKLYFGRKIFG